MRNKNTKYQVGNRIFKTLSTAMFYAKEKGLEVKPIV